MNRYIPLAVAIFLIGATTIVQGRYSFRWGEPKSEKVDRFIRHLSQVPMKIGDWEGVETEGTDARQREVAGIEGQIERTYTNLRGESVSVSLVCGNRYNMSTHNPDACYAAAGYSMDLEGDRLSTVEYKDSNGETDSVKMVTAKFKKEDPSQTLEVRLFWAWNAEGKWEAPSSDPRLGLPHHEAWYKLYLRAAEIPRSNFGDINPIVDSPAHKFAEVFLPVLDKVLFSDAENDEKTQVDSSAQPSISQEPSDSLEKPVTAAGA